MIKEKLPLENLQILLEWLQEHKQVLKELERRSLKILLLMVLQNSLWKMLRENPNLKMIIPVKE
jgi:hypothetical protein